MNKKLYVGNLLYEVTDEELRDFFSQAGTVISASVVRFHDSGRSKGFAFVEFDTEEEAQKAVDMFNNQDYKGRQLLVSEARPPKPRTFGDRPSYGDRPPRRNGFRRDYQGDDI
ncbi:RNA-binding protein [Candidatus Roizmanbacteria bacterium]|nr:RNA-binding protein [Candidatus Roizmanbacteria bacterium]